MTKLIFFFQNKFEKSIHMKTALFPIALPLISSLWRKADKPNAISKSFIFFFHPPSCPKTTLDLYIGLLSFLFFPLSSKFLILYSAHRLIFVISYDITNIQRINMFLISDYGYITVFPVQMRLIFVQSIFLS